MARCQRCHRVLKDIETVKVGYGKICYKKTFGKKFPTEKKYKLSSFHFQKSNEDIQEEIPPLFDDKYFE